MQSAVFTGRGARQTHRLYVLDMIVKLAYWKYFMNLANIFLFRGHVNFNIPTHFLNENFEKAL